ncbi:MAG: type II toxin-antitoxin system Phd/YefM family antitoxin [Pseudonocardiaceae bacterium]
METIGLRELNQNPSRAVARVRAGASLIVTDRGKPVLRMVPEVEHPSTLQQMIAAGTVRPPAACGMPELIPDLAPGVESLADLLVADREKERSR